MDEATRRFLDRVAVVLRERGERPTHSAIEAAMREVLRRDAEILDALAEESRLRAAGVPVLSAEGRMGAAARERITRGIYDAARREVAS